MNLTVGQKLYFVPRDRNCGREGEVIVTAVGRKWATISGQWRGMRVDKRELWVDGNGYSSPGKCYLSKGDYLEQRAIEDSWGIFRLDVSTRYQVPKGLDADAIRRAKELLCL